MDSNMIISGTNNLSFIPSSSPPPIEAVSLHSDLEDDCEFPLDDQFDITGLSQKLNKNLESHANHFTTSSKSNSGEAPSLSNVNSIENDFSNNVRTSYKKEIGLFPAMSPPPLTQVASASDSLSPISEKGIELTTSLNHFDVNVEVKICEEECINDVSSVPHHSFFPIIEGGVELNSSPNHWEFNAESSTFETEVKASEEESEADDFGEFSSNPILHEINPSNDYITSSERTVLPAENLSCCEIDDTKVIHRDSDDSEDFKNKSTTHVNENIVLQTPSNSDHLRENKLKVSHCGNESDSLQHHSHRTSPTPDVSSNFDCPRTNNIISEIQDDFGDFSSNVCDNEVHSNDSKVVDVDCNETGDEFGDFTSTSNNDGFELEFSDEEENMMNEDVLGEEMTLNDKVNEKPSEITEKFKSLINRWLQFSKDEFFEDYDIRILAPCLDDVTSRDSEVWKHLQDIESSSSLKISWATTGLNKLFLSSLNVDVRNIFYSHKWNSSIPLFAQTLSFSPLTPAKPSPSSSFDAKHFPNSEPTKEPNSDNIVSDIILSSDTNDNDGDVIPPAQFDWSSSGLKNPLDDPASSFSSFLAGEVLFQDRRKSDFNCDTSHSFLADLEKEILDEESAPPAPTTSNQSPILQKILRGEKSTAPTSTTDVSSLPPEVQEAVKRLPNLSFMRSKVLMFPLLDDSLK